MSVPARGKVDAHYPDGESALAECRRGKRRGPECLRVVRDSLMTLTRRQRGRDSWSFRLPNSLRIRATAPSVRAFVDGNRIFDLERRRMKFDVRRTHW
jgi:hypothetical protein